jgi:ligand-binding SRPBCC domain-containing protein
MPKIELITKINASVERCFELALSVDLHLISASQTQEKVIKGRQNGIFELGEEVTWQAKHFGIWQTLTVKITEMQAPNYFCDEMLKGSFKKMRHEHHFQSIDNQTIMKDIFVFESPLSYLGKLVNYLFLENYLRKFLEKRNQVIKLTAEKLNT